MNNELVTAIYKIREKAATLQKDIDAIDRIPNLTDGEKQMAIEAGNWLRGFNCFALGGLAAAAGITD